MAKIGIEDIGAITETVKTRTKKGLVDVEVGGVQAKDIYYLIKIYPEFRALLEGKLRQLFKDHKDLPERLMKYGPEFIGTVIAFGMNEGERDDKLMEKIKKEAKIAASWPVGTQVKFLAAVIRCTFEDGFGPFAQAFNAIKGAFVNRPNTSAPGTPSSGTSRAALHMDTADKRRGPIRLAS